MAICIATLKFEDCDQQRIYSIIMQLEIENEQHPNEEASEAFDKESKFIKFEWLAKNYCLNNLLSQISLNILNFYPINHDYTEIVTPPPEFILS
jgi:hypothetical protein